MTGDPDPRSEASRTIAVDVRIADFRWRAQLPQAPALVRRAARAALARALVGAGAGDAPLEVSFLLAGDALLRQLNRDYRGQDKATNVLSFPAEDDRSGGGSLAGPRLLGDVVLGLETLQREAAAQNKSLSDHLCHLAVHGVLHLVGYDHEEDAEAERMERLEVQTLAGLSIADPYARRPRTVLAKAARGATPGGVA